RKNPWNLLRIQRRNHDEFNDKFRMLHILPHSLKQDYPLKDHMKMISRMLILFLNGIFIGLTFLTPAWGRLAPYDGIGGNGGIPFRLDYGEYGILVGLNGRSGVVVDQVTGLCVKIDPVSGIW